MSGVNPVFMELMRRYKALHDAGQGQTEEAALLFGEAMHYAPEDFKRDAHDKAVEMGLIPAVPDGYTPDGEPLYILEKMAERLGINAADVPEIFRRHSYDGPMHRTN